MRLAFVAKAAIVVVLAVLIGRELIWSLRYLLTPVSVPASVMSSTIPSCADCNLLLISLDTLRADRAEKMPALNKIAQSSLTFPNAYANGTFTTPNHMTVFTSLYPSTHKVESGGVYKVNFKQERPYKSTEPEAHILDEKYKTLAEILKQNGFSTYWNGPLRLKFLSFNDGFARGFEHFGPSPFWRGIDLPGAEGPGFDKKSLEPLFAKAKTKRKFLFLHSYVAHTPFVLPQADPPKTHELPFSPQMTDGFIKFTQGDPTFFINQNYLSAIPASEKDRALKTCTNLGELAACFDKYSSVDAFVHAMGLWQMRILRKVLDQEPSQLEISSVAVGYDSNVRRLDSQIQEMWDALETSGALKNTLVVFFADHGEALFEHKELGHASFFQHIVRVPIIIYHPHLRARIEFPQMTSLVNVMPAILDLLAVEGPKQMQGVVPWRTEYEYVHGDSSGGWYVSDGRWKLISDYEGVQKLFYLPLDPMEFSDRSRDFNPWSISAFSRLSRVRKDHELGAALN